MNKDARTNAVSPRQSAKKAQAARARRTWVVLASLVAGLAGTGALLRALAPPPLSQTAALLAVVQEQPGDVTADVLRGVVPGRWHSIYLHHSQTTAGNALSLGERFGELPDHFIIGNGRSLSDGAVETGPRWSEQRSAGGIPGVRISPDCISICVVGDLNQSPLTPMQHSALLKLVTMLQDQLSIGKDRVYVGVDVNDESIAGAGRLFPFEQFRSQLLP